jgi:H+/Cl- antiporter ClcA
VSSTVIADEGPTARTQLILAVPSALIGVVSALVLYAIDWMSEVLHDGIWGSLPSIFGVSPSSPAWIIGVLTATGLAVGLAIQFLPGHGGRDSATTELIAPPLRSAALPSLVTVTVLALAGGVSLGPESPVIAINTGILVALLSRWWPRLPTDLVVLITAAGTIGALFGTPVAAALLLTGVVAQRQSGGELWDRLFLPLVAAGAGAITSTLLGQPGFGLAVGEYTTVRAIDILSVVVIASVAAALGLVAAVVFPVVHRAFRTLRYPVLYVTAGGLLLGILGAIGGPVTLFKGVTQMADLTAHRDDYTAAQLALITVIKVVALVIAAASGFRGGRIFPSVFIGVAIGVLSNSLLPAIPLAVAIAAGVLGVVLAVARDGWIAIFSAVAVTGAVAVLPLLCIAILPVWLLVSRGPVMLVKAPPPPLSPPPPPPQPQSNG